MSSKVLDEYLVITRKLVSCNNAERMTILQNTHTEDKKTTRV